MKVGSGDAGRGYEEFVAANLPHICRLVGIPIPTRGQTRVRWRPALMPEVVEVDVAFIASGTLVLVECKSWNRPVPWDNVLGTFAKFHRIADCYPNHRVHGLFIAKSALERRAVKEVHRGDSVLPLSQVLGSHHTLVVPYGSIVGWLRVYEASKGTLLVSHVEPADELRGLDVIYSESTESMLMADRLSAACELYRHPDSPPSLRVHALAGMATVFSHVEMYDEAVRASDLALHLQVSGAQYDRLLNIRAGAEVGRSLQRSQAVRPGYAQVRRILLASEDMVPQERASALLLVGAWLNAIDDSQAALTYLDQVRQISQELDTPSAAYLSLVGEVRRLETLPLHDRLDHLSDVEQFLPHLGTIHRELANGLISRIQIGLSTTIGSGRAFDLELCRSDSSVDVETSFNDPLT